MRRQRQRHAGFSPAAAVLACWLHPVRGGGGQQVVNQFRASAAADCAALVPTEDPPFGGLWCDQPAIFLLARSRLRRFERAPLELDRYAGKKRGFCQRKAGPSVPRTFAECCCSLARQRRQPSYHRHEGVEINRLGDVEVEAGFDGGGYVAFRCVAGHGDREYVTSNLQST
jgi:hypothetical protein